MLLTLPDVAWPLDGGKRLRCAGVLRGLVEVAEVDLVVLFSEAPDRGAPFPPGSAVRRWSRLAPPPLDRLTAARRLVQGRVPWKIAAQHWQQVRSHLRDWADPAGYDVVWFGGLDHAFSLRGTVSARSSVVDFDDIETEKWREYLAQPVTSWGLRLERWQRRIELPLWSRVERDAVHHHDVAVVCSDDDRARLEESAGRTVMVVPNTYPDPGPAVGRHRGAEPAFLFVGNFAVAANVDAAEQLVREVLPLLRKQVPQARVRLVGREAHLVSHLEGAEGLVLVGSVPDVADELARATAVLVPMRYGGGTRLKLLEAFAVGVPVVTSPLGAMGLRAVDGRHLLLGRTAEELATAAARVALEPGLGAGLATEARLLYERAFSPQASTSAVHAVLSELPAVRPAQGG